MIKTVVRDADPAVVSISHASPDKLYVSLDTNTGDMFFLTKYVYMVDGVVTPHFHWQSVDSFRSHPDKTPCSFWLALDRVSDKKYKLYQLDSSGEFLHLLVDLTVGNPVGTTTRSTLVDRMRL